MEGALGYIFLGLIIFAGYKAGKHFSLYDFMYNRKRPAILRLEELRKDYDAVQDLETVTKIVESNPDLEIFMYCKYSDFGGGSDKEVRFPIKPNSRMIKMLCEEEKKRLRSDMGKTERIFRLPFNE